MYGAGYEKWSLERTTFEDLPHEILMDNRAIEGTSIATKKTSLAVARI